MLSRVLPFIEWFRGYKASDLKVDLIAGLTVALVLIPQSMAYAQLAGLPVHYGLYASFLPPMIAALFGSSRQLATGPVAIVSLMTSVTLEPLATAGSESYVAYAIMLALVIGAFQFCLGFVKLGLVVNFLSHPVVNGFTNGAAIIIATSQLSKLFGVHVDKAEHHYETIYRVVESAFHFTHWPTLVMGMGAFVLMYGIRKYNPRIPYVLIAVVLTTGLSFLVGFQRDREVSVESIDSAKTLAIIDSFNQVTKEIAELSKKRTELASSQQSMAEDTEASVDLHRDRQVVDLRMSRANERAAELRAQLRDILFVGVITAGDGLRLVPRDELKEPVETDGRTWRLKVGNKPLAKEAITVIGGGDVVGHIPSGLPKLSAPRLDLDLMIRLLPNAIIISLLGFMEAISIAKAMAAKTGQRLDPNQELIGQGISNVLGALGSSYPVSGSFSRSAVNLQAGAVTGLSSVFTSLIVVVALLFLTPLLFHLPQAVLAAVIMMAVLGLVNVSGFVHAWKAQWYDGFISVASFIGTLVFAPYLEEGIMIGIGLSVAVFLYKSMRPTVASLSLHDQAFRDAAKFGLKQCERLAIVRFDGPLFFANASFLEEQVTRRIEQMPKLREILLVANGINDMDASGEEALSLLVDRVRSAGYKLSFCGFNEPVMAVLKRTYLLQKIGRENIYDELSTALAELHPRAHESSDEQNCPLLSPATEAVTTEQKELLTCP